MAVGRLTAVKVEPEKRFLARRHELTPAALVYRGIGGGSVLVLRRAAALARVTGGTASVSNNGRFFRRASVNSVSRQKSKWQSSAISVTSSADPTLVTRRDYLAPEYRSASPPPRLW
jgi:hypothetical protein